MSNTGASPRRGKKSDSAFRTISEVATELGVQQHVLRFWESRFDAVQPLKRGGGRRYYRPEDVTLLRTIRDRLYDDGFTIKGVQRLLEEKGVDVFINEANQPASVISTVAPSDVLIEPGLPLDLPQTPETPKVEKPAKTGLTSHQKKEIKAAIQELESLKNSLDQVLA